VATVQLTFDKTATQSEQESVKQAFEDAGLSAEVFVELIESRSVDIPPWVIYATAAAGGIFFTGFIGQAGADAWKGLRDLIGKVFHARAASRAPRGVVVVRLTDVRETVIFNHGLPDVAFRQIVELEILHTESGQLNWDPKTETWRDPLDTAHE
jgi:hypothetical protein